MVQPKSILKKPSGQSSSRILPAEAQSRAGPSQYKPKAGSKLKHSITISKRTSETKSTAGPRRRVENADDEGEDEDIEDESSGNEEEELGTDEEIERAQDRGVKGKTAVKRKRPTTADEFGSALTALLSEPTRPTKAQKTTEPSEGTPAALPDPQSDVKPSTKAKRSQPILSLSRAKLPPTATTEKLERQAARAVKREKEEKEDRARVRDVVEGWSHRGATEGEVVGGLEFEKGLRKTAQRGVIKLFNAILTASRQETAMADPGAATLAKSGAISKVKGYGKKDKNNVLGRGNREQLTKESFLDLVKRGSA